MNKLFMAIYAPLMAVQLVFLYPGIPDARVDNGSHLAASAPQGLSEAVCYENAFEYCRMGQYSEAVVHFKTFLLTYPQSALADNAQFWIGECYRAQHELDAAIAAYQSVIDDYPGGTKLPRAMLHQGFAYVKTGDRANARLVLQKLADGFPMTEEAEIAKRVLNRIEKRNCRIRSLSPEMSEWKILKEMRHTRVQSRGMPEETTVHEEIARRDRAVKAYQKKIGRIIRSNWSFPFLLFNIKQEKIPEAAVQITVRKDGAVIRISFKEPSHHELFDESIINAIRQSDPLPEFPSGYEKRYEILEFRFSLKGALFK